MTCKFIFVQFGLGENYLREYFLDENLLDEKKQITVCVRNEVNKHFGTIPVRPFPSMVQSDGMDSRYRV